MRFLTRDGLAKDPVRQFHRWFRDAKRSKRIPMPDAMCVSTCETDGFPAGRMVLLKQADARGFVFYTNLESPKSRALRKSRRAALTFYWDPPGRQVRVVGTATPVGKKEADAYFATRDRMSQLGAWASRQSALLKDRATLERRVGEFERKFRGGPVPRPASWGAFRVKPKTIEFWQRRPYRLNDRFVYKRRRKGWTISRLYP